MKIILASKSPRRREILEQMGMEFEIAPAVSEEIITDTEPAKVVESLSGQKAREIAGKAAANMESHAGTAADTESNADAGADTESNAGAACGEAILVIGADTVVAQGGKILGKPADEEDAISMLRELQGREHSVFTGVTLIYIAEDGTSEEKTFSEETKVSFYPMSDEEIRAYVATGEPMDKAGAYGIQGKAFVYVSGIEGDYYNVVGLPAARIYQEMRMEKWI